MVTDRVKSHRHWLTCLLGTTSDWKPHADSLLKAGVVPLMVLHADYHKLLEDSVLPTSLITEQNGQLYDVPNQPASPYEAQTLVAFSPYKTTLYDSLSMDFKTSPAFFKTNTAFCTSLIKICESR